MLYIKALHIIAMVAWFAGLFYLPRLFVYHAQAQDVISIDRFKLMEYRLYYYITWPSALLTTGLGFWMIAFNTHYYLTAGWMHIKLTLVLLLWGYHLASGHYVRLFAHNNNQRSVKFYRIYNEVPTLLLVAIVMMVVVKPQLF